MSEIFSQKRYTTARRSFFAAVALLSLLHTASALPEGFIDEPASTGWNLPAGFTFDANGRQFVWEKAGRVSSVSSNGTRKLLIDISEEVGNWRDYGLLGFALDPKFLTNGRFYLFYVVDRHHLLNFGTSSYDPAKDQYFAATIARITRYQADPATAFTTVVPGSRKILVGESKSTGIPILHTSHGAGSLIFGEDGTLLASVGDGASYSFVDTGSSIDSYDAQALADGIIPAKEKVGAFRPQLVDSLSGKILRIDPNSGDGIPSNPFFISTNPRAPRSRVWTLGVRNPFRIALKPGTGIPDPAAADPGTLIFGDVGWNQWEEINVVEAGGANCGWPLFEGLNSRAEYAASRTYNLDAPNPLFGQPGASEPFFAFQDLLKQAQKDHTPSFPNPSNPKQSVPSSIPRFMHHRPIIEWKHGADVTRIPTFIGNTAAAISIDDPASTVSGPRFRGNASTSGFWHTGVGVPETYANTYFHADYVRQWVRTFRFDDSGALTSEAWFTTLPGRIAALGMNPVDGSIHYIDYDKQEVRRISYIGNTNRSPIPVAKADKSHGPSPLTVSFDASASTDPDGNALSYSWNFGDGSTSSQIKPSKTFTVASGTPKKFDVTLTVTDSKGAAKSTSLTVSANNTPPTAVITKPADGSRYNLGTQSSAQLAAAVSDAEQSASSLQHRWQVTLYHDEHVHPEPVIESPTADVVLSSTPASAEFYAYRINLTVTDSYGLSTSTDSWLYPNDGGTSISLLSPKPGQTFSPGTPVTLEVAPPAGTTRVIFRANGVAVGQATSAPFRSSWTPPAEGDYSVVAHILTNGVSSTTLASKISIALPKPQSNSLPSPWNSANVGSSPINGQTTEAAGTFTLKSTGGDSWGSNDDLHFAYQRLAGDCQITARILDIADTHAWAKAGLMFRSSLASNSPHAFVATTAQKGVALYSRTSTGANTDLTVRSGLTNPRWLRLVRSGKNITAFHSDSGSTWVPVKTLTLDLGDSIYVGMALASVTQSIQGSAVFDNVSTQFGSVGTSWTNTDLTATENPNLPGSFQNGTGSFSRTGTDSFTVTGSGADVYGTSDEFNFVRQSLSGDGEIIAKVTSISASDPWAKAGVMVRSSTAKNAAHAFMAISPGNGAAYVFRKSTGASSTLRRYAQASAPYWVRIVRSGNSVSGFHSPNGSTWTLVSTESISLGSALEVGLAVTSHDAASTATADFQNVSIKGFGGGNTNIPPQVALASPADGASVAAGSDLTLAAWFSDPDGSVTSVGYYANGQLVGQINSSPWTLKAVFPVAGTYEIIAAAVDDDGSVTFSTPVNLTVSGSSSAPPAPWVPSDIGPTVSPGTASASGKLITLQAAGEEIYGTQDSFFFLRQPLVGDGEIIARVSALSASHSWAKAGLMIRQDLTPASPHVTVALTPDKGALLLTRPTAAAETSMIRHPSPTPPRWIKLTRSGNTFSASHSENGTSWTLISQTTAVLPRQALIGLAFTARSSSTPGAATFENISITSPPK